YHNLSSTASHIRWTSYGDASGSFPVRAAIPKKTRTARLSRHHILVSKTTNIHADFCFLNSRDLIHHQATNSSQSVARARLNEEPKKRSIGWIGHLGESPPDAVFLRSPFHQKRSKSRRASLPAPIGDGVDKVLVLLGMGTAGNSQGLPACLCDENGRAHVGHPDLDGP